MVKRRWSRRNSPGVPWNPGVVVAPLVAAPMAAQQCNGIGAANDSWGELTLLLRRTNKLTRTKIDKSLLYQIRWRLYRPISNVYAFCPASDRRLRKLTNAKDSIWVNHPLISPRFSIFFFKRLLCRLLKICRKSVSRIELWVVDAAFVKQKPLKRFKNSSWDNHQLRCRFWSRLGRDCCYWRINIY